MSYTDHQRELREAGFGAMWSPTPRIMVDVRVDSGRIVAAVVVDGQRVMLILEDEFAADREPEGEMIE